MERPTYIDRHTQASVRSNTISYITADVPEDVTLDEYARAVAERRRRDPTVLRRIANRVGYANAADTTAGGW
jgi:hypothetical protein